MNVTVNYEGEDGLRAEIYVPDLDSDTLILELFNKVEQLSMKYRIPSVKVQPMTITISLEEQ